MIKLHIGLDTHKENAVIAKAFTGDEDPVIRGKCSSDVVRLTKAIMQMLKKHNLTKQDGCGYLAEHERRICR